MGRGVFLGLVAAPFFVSGPNMRQRSTSPIRGLLAAVAPEMALGTGVVLLPLLNPVLLAEEAATIDHPASGNFTLRVGLGHRDAEFQAFRAPRFREYIEVIRRL